MYLLCPQSRLPITTEWTVSSFVLSCITLHPEGIWMASGALDVNSGITTAVSRDIHLNYSPWSSFVLQSGRLSPCNLVLVTGFCLEGCWICISLTQHSDSVDKQQVCGVFQTEPATRVLLFSALANTGHGHTELYVKQCFVEHFFLLVCLSQ